MLEKRENHVLFQKASLNTSPHLQSPLATKGSAGMPGVSGGPRSPSDSSSFSVLAPVTHLSAPGLGWGLFDVGLLDMLV